MDASVQVSAECLLKPGILLPTNLAVAHRQRPVMKLLQPRHNLSLTRLSSNRYCQCCEAVPACEFKVELLVAKRVLGMKGALSTACQPACLSPPSIGDEGV